jgi:hypothetical protein
MDTANIKEKIQTQTKNNKISCKQAFKIAEEAGISPGVLGEMLNEMKIKVAACQLGCFQ